MTLIYKDRSPGRPYVNARESFVTEQIKLGTIQPLFNNEPERGCVLVDPDKWEDLVEAVNDSNAEFDELENEDDGSDDEEVTEAEAKYVTDVTVTDPDTNLPVTLAVFKDSRTGGMLAIDASFLDQDDTDVVPSPFYEDVKLRLTGID